MRHPKKEAMTPEDWERIVKVLNMFQHNAEYMSTRRHLLDYLGVEEKAA